MSAKGSTFLLSEQLKNNFLNTYILCKVFERLVAVRLGRLWNEEVCFQPPNSPIGNVLALVMPFCVRHTPYRVLYR